jgi:hypothetical protein
MTGPVTSTTRAINSDAKSFATAYCGLSGSCSVRMDLM